jgi:hypothetical protein
LATAVVTCVVIFLCRVSACPAGTLGEALPVSSRPNCQRGIIATLPSPGSSPDAPDASPSPNASIALPDTADPAASTPSLPAPFCRQPRIGRGLSRSRVDFRRTDDPLQRGNEFYRYAIKPTEEAVNDTSSAPRIIHSVSSFVVSNRMKQTAAIAYVTGPVKPSRPTGLLQRATDRHSR